MTRKRPVRLFTTATSITLLSLLLTSCSPEPDNSTPPTPTQPPAGTSQPTTQPVATTTILKATWPEPDSPVGDRHILGGEVHYQGQEGDLRATVTLGDAPNSNPDMFLLVVLGPEHREDGCSDGIVLVASTGSEDVTEWNAFDGDDLTGSGTAQRETAGNSIQLSVSDPALKDKELSCAQAVLVDKASLTGGTLTVHDQTPAVEFTREEVPDAPTAPSDTSAVAADPVSPIGESLAGRYFWTFKSELGSGWNTSAVVFLDDTTAHIGFPPAGLKPDCRTQGTGRFFSADFSPGCVDYSYDPATGAIRIGTETGEVAGNHLRLRALNFYPLAQPTSGSTIAVQLINKDYIGCDGMPGCTTTSRTLLLTTGGEFALAKGTIASQGSVGTAMSHYPSDEHGTYRILDAGRIEMAYANGKRVVSTLGYELDDTGSPDPRGTGLLLGDVNFYPAD